MIGALILGLLAGFLARALLPGKHNMGFFATLLLGLVGAFVGYLIFNRVFGIGDDAAFDLGGLIGAIIGSMIVLAVYERIAKPKT